VYVCVCVAVPYNAGGHADEWEFGAV